MKERAIIAHYTAHPSQPPINEKYVFLKKACLVRVEFVGQANLFPIGFCA
jgi:hypothetical protein